MNNDGMFKELIENSDDIVIVTDREFKIRYISSSVTKAFGVEPIKLLGLNIFNFVTPDKVESWRSCLQDTSYSSFTEEISLKLTGREVTYFDIQVSNFFSKSDIGGLVLKLHDITAKKSKEKELLKSNQQLDQVIYKTTHDLKAPLMSAMGLVNLAQMAPESEKDEYLAMIRKSLLRLNSYIEEMNGFFRNEKLAIRREKIEISELLRDELENIQNLHGKDGIDIDVDVQGQADLYTDSIRLKTIIGNILSNAVKYHDANKLKPFIGISVLISEERLDIRISDNGIGIEPEYQQKIFDLFFRATTQSQGTGLGLFIVKDTIEKLKGSIELSSVPGEGTTFRISVPNQVMHSVEA